MEEIKKDTAQKSQTEELKEKYGKVYRVGATIEVDDETEKNVEFFFKRPSTAIVRYKSFHSSRYLRSFSSGAGSRCSSLTTWSRRAGCLSRRTLRSSRPWRSPSVRSCSGCWASPNRQI